MWRRTVKAIALIVELPSLCLSYREELSRLFNSALMSAHSEVEGTASAVKVPETLSEWFALLDLTLKDASVEELAVHLSKKEDAQTRMYDRWATSQEVKIICEIGFNGGHSALRFLAQGNATLYVFDHGERKISQVAARFMKKQFGDRFVVVWGDRAKTVPQFIRNHNETKCDVIILDDGHMFDVALSDLMNMEAMAATKNAVAINGTKCDDWRCEGPARAWNASLQEGCVMEYAPEVGYSFSVGEYTHQNRYACLLLKHTGYSSQKLGVFMIPEFVIIFCLICSACLRIRPVPMPASTCGGAANSKARKTILK